MSDSAKETVPSEAMMEWTEQVRGFEARIVALEGLRDENAKAAEFWKSAAKTHEAEVKRLNKDLDRWLEYEQAMEAKVERLKEELGQALANISKSYVQRLKARLESKDAEVERLQELNKSLGMSSDNWRSAAAEKSAEVERLQGLRDENADAAEWWKHRAAVAEAEVEAKAEMWEQTWERAADNGVNMNEYVKQLQAEAERLRAERDDLFYRFKNTEEDRLAAVAEVERLQGLLGETNDLAAERYNEVERLRAEQAALQLRLMRFEAVAEAVHNAFKPGARLPHEQAKALTDLAIAIREQPAGSDHIHVHLD